MAIIAQGTPGHDQEPLLTPGISIPIDQKWVFISTSRMSMDLPLSLLKGAVKNIEMIFNTNVIKQNHCVITSQDSEDGKNVGTVAMQEIKIAADPQC